MNCRMKSTLFPTHGHITVPAWPCLPVRAPALRFAGDSEYGDAWWPEVALFASGRLVHET